MPRDKIPIRPKIFAVRRIVAYMPNMNAAVRHFRAFNFVEGSEKVAACSVPSLLRGLPTPDPTSQPASVPKDLLAGLTLHEVGTRSTSMALLGPTRGADYSVLDQFKETKEVKEAKEAGKGPSPVDNLECLAVECDDSLKKDFRDLFMDRDVSKGPLSIITLSQRTTNDMSAWSLEVEEEREQLLEKFVLSAAEICDSLHQAGYWADFVEPESGRLYHGAYSPATLFETDHRYRKLGFDIRDLGCCKVIAHSLWGAHVYVGSLFTDAPIDHPAIARLQRY